MMWEKTSGIKLHIGVDILGLPHAIKITTANVTDRNGATDMISYYHNHTNNLFRMKKVLADSAYSGKKFADRIKARPHKRKLKSKRIQDKIET